MAAHLVTAGFEKRMLCSDCVTQMVAEVGVTMTYFSVALISADDLAILKFPWCDACDASFAGLIEQKEVLA